MRTLLLLALSVSIPSLCAPENSTPRATTAKPQVVTPTAPAIPDAELQQRIQEKFAKSKAGGGKFTVKVSNGVAYLSGRADVVQHKGAATRMAKASGARKVVNNITLSEAAKQRASRDLHQPKARRAHVKQG